MPKENDKPQLDLAQPAGETTNVEQYEFEPIQGYPMLNWRGKRPFRSTQFYPAQLKEQHGSDVDGWRNRIYWGDNLQVMSHLLKEFRGKVDLVYIDPPFDSRVDYSKKISVKGNVTSNDLNGFEEKQYSDIWLNDEYLQFMYTRFILARELMSDHGIILVHADWHKSHHLRCLLDEVFGVDNFLNEVIWKYDGPGAPSKTRFASKHDTIIRYCRDENALSKRINFIKQNSDQTAYEMYGNAFVPDSTANYEKDRDGRYYFTLPRGDYSDESIERLRREGRIMETSRGNVRIKYFVEKVPGGFLRNEKLQDVWNDIASLGLAANALENTKYPTQKPEKLLARLIASSSAKKDLVFDFFMGSGTTQAAAMKLGRRFIGADINLGAVQTTTKRLLKVAAELEEKQAKLGLEPPKTASTDEPEADKPAEPTVFFTGFEVYNVNHYDVFRNPVQAKGLLIEALEIQPLGPSALYDGEKDGRMVKIMPVNRIATKADLNELTAGFDWKGFERKQATLKANEPVEKILLVCMGHEPDIKAALELAAKPFKIDVEVVDILRDKSNLEFKRDAEAEIAIEGGQLVIRAFYPMNLLQKLSLLKENVEDWRELVESIMVDWNYDGAVLTPAVVDLPGKNALVIGTYPVPTDAGTIRVKITDLLSESLEVEVTHG